VITLAARSRAGRRLASPVVHDMETSTMMLTSKHETPCMKEEPQTDAKIAFVWATFSLIRPTEVTITNSGSFGFGYDALGRRTSLTRPNGVNTSYSYDSLSRLLGVLHNGGALPGSASYTYDAAGNRLTKTALQQGCPHPGAAHDSGRIEYSTEESAMIDTSNHSEFRGFARAGQILGGATVLLTLALAGSTRAWGQAPCTQGIASVTLDKGSVIALDSAPLGMATGTVTLNCHSWYEPTQIAVTVSPNNGVLGCTGAWVGEGGTSAQFFCGAGVNQSGAFSITGTIVNQLSGLGSTGSAALTVVANGPPASGGNLGTGGKNGCNCTAGKPINLTDGNTWIQERDYAVPGLGGGLELSRVWNSRLGYAEPPAMAGTFGLGWRSTYEEMLAGPDANSNMTYWRGDGSSWTFTYTSGLSTYSLASPPDERAQLVQNLVAGGFTLTFPDGAQKVFNSNNLLAAIIDRNNNQTTLAYDSFNRLVSVTSPGGSTLTFTYGDPNNPMQATTVADAVGAVATYNDDSSSRLTMVTYADGSTLNFTNDPNSSMILSVTDSQGKLLESHTYDAQNRGLTSTRANGVDSISLVY